LKKRNLGSSGTCIPDKENGILSTPSIGADTRVCPYKNSLTLALSQREREFNVVLSHPSNRCPATLPEKCTRLSDGPYSLCLAGKIDPWRPRKNREKNSGSPPEPPGIDTQ